MPSASMVDRLLTAADTLMETKPRSAAYRRRAVSTAYYAVFHALAKICTETLLPNVRRTEEEYSRVYRALDHGPLRNAFAQAPLKDHPEIKRIGPIIVRLQNERHRADYSPPDMKIFAIEEVEELIAQAKLVVDALQKLDTTSHRALATCLLFRDRKS